MTLHKRVNYILLLVLIASSLGLGYIIGKEFTEPETEYRVETIEIPVIITQNHTVYEFIEVPTPFPIYVNSTRVIEIRVPTPIPLKHFPDKTTLLTFISEDDTDNLPYTDRWTCFDYTIRTIENAEQLGYRVYFFYRNNPDGTAHAMCMAYIVEEAEYVIWEPQNDSIQFTWGSNIAGTPTWMTPPT